MNHLSRGKEDPSFEVVIQVWQSIFVLEYCLVNLSNFYFFHLSKFWSAVDFLLCDIWDNILLAIVFGKLCYLLLVYQ